MHTARLMLVVVSLAALDGCGLPTDDGEFRDCSTIKGLTLKPTTPRPQSAPLAVGETSSLQAAIGPAMETCPRPGSRFVRLQWYANIGSGDPKVAVRLATCEACTVLFEGPGGDSRDLGLQGAARLEGSSQLVTFEVMGLKPGRGSLTVFACLDEGCLQVASDQLSFDVFAR